VIVEEKVEGEESSFQALCDGRHLTFLPETRDYKRAFDGDRGPNTGGMGSYKDSGEILPFMTKVDREKEIELVTKLFNELRKKAGKTDLRGVPFYDAFIHTSKGPRILENNSRPGDPEIQNILPLLKDDFVDICYKIIEGNLTNVSIDPKASVVTYKAPPDYGGYSSAFPDQINKDEIDTPVILGEAEKLERKYGGSIRIYPGSLDLRNAEVYSLSSRAVCVVGAADDIQTAREISLEGLKAIRGGALWNRDDIAAREHIDKSIEHMSRLRQLQS
jgi:phosphoribosylamine--glycine ligase